MTRTQLEDAIYALVQPRLDMTTIWAHPTSATGAAVRRPALPYAVLNVVSERAEGSADGYGDAGLVGSDYLQTLRADRYARVSLRIYGSGGWDAAQDLRLYLRTDAAAAAAGAAGVGLVEVTDPQDLTMINGAGWEPVVGLDLVWHHRYSLQTDEGYIESATIGVTYTEAGATVATDTITIDAGA